MERLIATILAVVGVVACAEEGREPVCAPGEVDECPCAGESNPGAQTCNAEGTEWSTCRCCEPSARRSCICSTAGKVGQQDCSAEGEWGNCYACR